MILLTADILDLKANPKRKATGTVLEAKLDRGRGAGRDGADSERHAARRRSVHRRQLLRQGSRADERPRRARAGSRRRRRRSRCSGWRAFPRPATSSRSSTTSPRRSRFRHFRQIEGARHGAWRARRRAVSTNCAQQMETGEVKELLVILKADVQGSVEVLKDTLTKLSTEKVKVRIIRVGRRRDHRIDVLLASASNATATGAATVIIGFNVRPESRADEVAKQENVDIRLHSIIYKVEEEIRNAMLGLLDATIKETVIGKAEVRDVIRVPKVGSVAGCMVINGIDQTHGAARV